MKWADLSTGPEPNAETQQFRKDNFDVHFCGYSGLKEHPRHDYAFPTRADKSDWLGTVYGFAIKRIPGTSYTDFGDSATCANLASAYVQWALANAADGTLFDCLNITASGHMPLVAAWFRDHLCPAFAAAGLQTWLNTGDGWTYGSSKPDSPWGVMIAATKFHFVQVAIDFTPIRPGSNIPRSGMPQFAAAVLGTTYWTNRGCTVLFGVFDEGRRNEAQVRAFFAQQLFQRPNVVCHYNSSWAEGDVHGQALNPVVPPPPPPPPPPAPTGEAKLGLLGDIPFPIYAPADNWWNLKVDTAPLDTNSAGIIAAIKSYDHHYVHPDFGGQWGIPYAVVGSATPLEQVAISNASESDRGYPGGPTGYPIPTAARTNNAYREAMGSTEGDRHMLLYDRDKRAVFELAYVDPYSGGWDANYGAVFKTDSNYRRTEGWTSTDAAGLCVLAGLVRYDEVYGSAPILHATRFSIKTSNGYVWPASHASANQAGGQPMGLRLRLKKSVDLSGFPAPMRKLFESWKVYGLIVADRGGNMYVQGTLDPRWDNGVLNPAFHALDADDFEVVQRGWRP